MGPRAKLRWEPGPTDHLRAFLLSTPFQTGAQLAFGEFLLSFFFWHRGIRFKANCLASTLYLVGSLLVAQNNLLGSKTLAFAFVVGSTWLAAFLGGSAVSLARLANHHGYIPLLCVLGVLGLLPFAAIRCSSNPVVANGFGILTNLVFGTIIIQGEFLWPREQAAKEFWNLMVSHIMLDACIAAGCMLFSAVFVLPTLAGDELRILLARSVRGIGKSASGYGSRIFAPFEDGIPDSSLKPGPVPQQHATQAAAPAAGPAVSSADAIEQAELAELQGPVVSQSQLVQPVSWPEDDEEDDIFMARLQAHTRPAGQGQAEHHSQHHAANAVRPLLEQARAAIIMSGLEPAWLHSVPVDPAKWTAVINAMDTLVTHVAACEMMVDERHLMVQIRRSAYSTPSMQHGAIQALAPVYKLVFAQVAAACALMADALTGTTAGRGAARLFEQDWAGMQAQLHDELQAAMRCYTDDLTAISQQAVWAPLSAIQLRALAFATTLTRGIIASMDKLEVALAAVLLPVPETPQSPAATPQPLARTLARRETFQAIAEGVALDPVLLEQDEAEDEAAQAHRQPHADPEMPATAATTHPYLPNPKLAPEAEARHLSDVELGKLPTYAHNAASTADRAPVLSGNGAKLPPNGTHAAAAPRKPARGIKYYLGFLVMPLTMLACLPALARLVEVFGHTLPTSVFKSKARKSLLADRAFQFGAKFWFTTSCVLVGVVIIQQDWATSRHWSPQYAFLTVPIVFAERVETTISKGFLRILGTAVGGALGLLVMFDSSLATKAVLLAVIVVTCTWMAGVASASPFKVAVILTIITFNVQVLCQFVGCCGAHGTVQFYLAQALAIAIGVLFVILVNNCILPWYASSSALGMLGSALTGSGQLLGDYYDAFYQAVQASAAAARTLDSGGGDATAAPVKLPAPNAVRMRIGQPLSGVQTMLAKEQVAWTFQRLGIMTMPPIVHAVLGQLLPLMDRLSALELSVLQHPAITGAFHSSAIWDQFLQPLDAELRATFRLAQAVAQTAAQVLQSDHHMASDSEVATQVKDLRGSIQDLEQQRVSLRRHYLDCRRTFYATLRVSAPGADGKLDPSTLCAYDDIFRFQSWLFSTYKVLDKLTLVGKTVAAAGEQLRPPAFAWLFAEATNWDRHNARLAKVSQFVRTAPANIVGHHTA